MRYLLHSDLPKPNKRCSFTLAVVHGVGFLLAQYIIASLLLISVYSICYPIRKVIYQPTPVKFNEAIECGIRQFEFLYKEFFLNFFSKMFDFEKLNFHTFAFFCIAWTPVIMALFIFWGYISRASFVCHRWWAGSLTFFAFILAIAEFSLIPMLFLTNGIINHILRMIGHSPISDLLAVLIVLSCIFAAFLVAWFCRCGRQDWMLGVNLLFNKVSAVFITFIALLVFAFLFFQSDIDPYDFILYIFIWPGLSLLLMTASVRSYIYFLRRWQIKEAARCGIEV